MCQKAEGESNYLLAVDKSTRLRGWEAFHAGVPLDDNPEPDHINLDYSQRRQWALGWETAKEGKEPW